jgi:hypothetical protein
MKGDKALMSPIMMNSESIRQFGNNAYGKPATALNILRETILGRELFDFAFKEYCRRWAFKHPNPADFFRSMEDASGMDLDWFWRGWFFGTDHVDLAITGVKWFQSSSLDPKVEKSLAREAAERAKTHIGIARNKTDIPVSVVDADTNMRDFYNRYDPFAVTKAEQMGYENMRAALNADELALLSNGYHFYQVDFANVGGLPMPIILEFSFADGSKQVERIPAEIWRYGDEVAAKVFYFKKEVVSVALDPFLETADVDFNNNHWPPKMQPTRFQLYKEREAPEDNPMRRAAGEPGNRK